MLLNVLFEVDRYVDLCIDRVNRLVAKVRLKNFLKDY
jgi:hypothetical protein